MYSDLAIKVENLSKCYFIYQHPKDRLKQFVLPHLQRAGRQKAKQYHSEFWALKNVSFEIEKGETVGIVGRNGSGKSTLLQILCGTLTQTTGSVETYGRIAALLELGSGFNPEFTGRENVYLNGAIHGFSPSQTDEIFDEIASFADIGSFLDQPVKTYSSGMYARLAFSASVFIKPDILIVDEILAVGDSAFQAKCMKAFHGLRDRGTSILLVSHDSYAIRNFCNRALYLKNGHFMAFGESTEVIREYSIEIEKALSNASKDKRSHGSCEVDNTAEVQPLSDSNIGLFRIVDVRLIGENRKPCSTAHTGDTIQLQFDFVCSNESPPAITFVVNLYRHDGLYIFGATTIMDQLPAISNGQGGTISITFPDLPLLAGEYMWRVAINDEHAFGVFAEANQVCHFRVEDKLQAVGLLNLNKQWDFKINSKGDSPWNA